jgi:hypothetical protein
LDTVPSSFYASNNSSSSTISEENMDEKYISSLLYSTVDVLNDSSLSSDAYYSHGFFRQVVEFPSPSPLLVLIIHEFLSFSNFLLKVRQEKTINKLNRYVSKLIEAAWRSFINSVEIHLQSAVYYRVKSSLQKNLIDMLSRMLGIPLLAQIEQQNETPSSQTISSLVESRKSEEKDKKQEESTLQEPNNITKFKQKTSVTSSSPSVQQPYPLLVQIQKNIQKSKLIKSGVYDISTISTALLSTTTQNVLANLRDDPFYEEAVSMIFRTDPILRRLEELVAAQEWTISQFISGAFRGGKRTKLAFPLPFDKTDVSFLPGNVPDPTLNATGSFSSCITPSFSSVFTSSSTYSPSNPSSTSLFSYISRSGMWFGTNHVGGWGGASYASATSSQDIPSVIKFIVRHIDRMKKERLTLKKFLRFGINCYEEGSTNFDVERASNCLSLDYVPNIYNEAIVQSCLSSAASLFGLYIDGFGNSVVFPSSKQEQSDVVDKISSSSLKPSFVKVEKTNKVCLLQTPEDHKSKLNLEGNIFSLSKVKLDEIKNKEEKTKLLLKKPENGEILKYFDSLEGLASTGKQDINMLIDPQKKTKLVTDSSGKLVSIEYVPEDKNAFARSDVFKVPMDIIRSEDSKYVSVVQRALLEKNLRSFPDSSPSNGVSDSEKQLQFSSRTASPKKLGLLKKGQPYIVEKGAKSSSYLQMENYISTIIPIASSSLSASSNVSQEVQLPSKPIYTKSLENSPEFSKLNKDIIYPKTSINLVVHTIQTAEELSSSTTLSTHLKIKSPVSSTHNVIGKNRSDPVKIKVLDEQLAPSIPNKKSILTDGFINRFCKTSSVKADSTNLGFVVKPPLLNFGLLLKNYIYSMKFTIKNIGIESERFFIQPFDEKKSCFKVVYVPQLVSSGIELTIEVRCCGNSIDKLLSLYSNENTENYSNENDRNKKSSLSTTFKISDKKPGSRKKSRADNSRGVNESENDVNILTHRLFVEDVIEIKTPMSIFFIKLQAEIDTDDEERENDIYLSKGVMCVGKFDK